MLTSIVAGIFMLGLLVFIHELGHFVVAKAFGVGVPVFSFGMGPRLAGLYWRGTDYRLSAIPVGGYVRMSGADPFGEEDPDEYVEPEEDFMQKSVWARLLIMLAGPAFNLVLPLIIYGFAAMLGEPQRAPVVGTVLDHSPAQAAGVLPEDEVRAVDGQPSRTWGEVLMALDERAGQSVFLAIQRADQSLTLELSVSPATDTGHIDMEDLGIYHTRRSTWVGVDGPGSAAWDAGLRTGDAILEVDGAEVRTWEQLMAALSGREHQIRFVHAVTGPDGSSTTEERAATLRAPLHWIPLPGDQVDNRWGLVPAMLYVGSVITDSPAHKAGVLPSDRLVAVDGTYLTEWSQLTPLVMNTAQDYSPEVAPGKLELLVSREGQLALHRFAPRMQREIIFDEVRYRPIMGIHQHPRAFIDGPEVRIYYGPGEAVSRAVEQTGDLVGFTMSILGKLLTGDIKGEEALGGPVAIFRIAGEGAREGIFHYFRLIGAISISLGILNLLPVPVLDGGHILFYLIEGVRGRPLSLAVRERLQMVGVLALVVLMLLVTANDVVDWITGSR